MQSKKKILFILPSLKAGGAERVISFIAKHLDADQFDVKLIVLGFKKDTVYDVSNIVVQYLNKHRLLLSIVSLFMTILKQKPSIVVSSIGHVNNMMGIFSLFFSKTKFVGREASVVSKMSKFSKTSSKVNFILMKFFYPRLSTIICQSEDMRQDFITELRLKHKKLVVIHNPITDSDSQFKKDALNDKMRFITVGRLSEEKGYLRIIDGLSKIRNYDFLYTIIGSGKEESNIKTRIESYNLTKKVSFIPYTSKVLEEISRNDFFIQGSYVEGFPNSLLESCTIGTPVIAFKAPGGTKDIVVPNFNGFLVEDEFEFVTLLNNINLLKSINREDVVLSVREKFKATTIVKQYEELFNRL